MRKTRSTGSINLRKTILPKNEPSKLQYQFINQKYSKYLNCPSCKLLMNNPQRIHPCGHTFCFDCLPHKGKCPTCSNKIQVIQKDLTGQALINEMVVRCLNSGCPFQGSLDQFKKFHQNNCKVKGGLDEWIKSMQGTLQEHEIIINKTSKSVDEQKEAQSQQTQKKIKLISRPKSPQRIYDYEQELWSQRVKPLIE